MNRGNVFATRGADERWVGYGAHGLRSLVAIQDLLGGELREVLLQEGGNQRMVERQSHMKTMHTVLQAEVAERLDEALARKVTRRGRRRAEIENLPRLGAPGWRLRLDEADHALGRLLRDEQRVARIRKRHQRRERLGQPVPETKQGRLRHRAVR